MDLKLKISPVFSWLIEVLLGCLANSHDKTSASASKLPSRGLQKKKNSEKSPNRLSLTHIIRSEVSVGVI